MMFWHDLEIDFVCFSPFGVLKILVLYEYFIFKFGW